MARINKKQENITVKFNLTEEEIKLAKAMAALEGKTLQEFFTPVIKNYIQDKKTILFKGE